LIIALFSIKGYPKKLRATAKNESKRIIKKILLTTAEVAEFPTASEPPLVWNPLRHPIQAMRAAKTILLDSPQTTSKRVSVFRV
jgi:hypothetical protein